MRIIACAIAGLRSQRKKVVGGKREPNGVAKRARGRFKVTVRSFSARGARRVAKLLALRLAKPGPEKQTNDYRDAQKKGADMRREKNDGIGKDVTPDPAGRLFQDAQPAEKMTTELRKYKKGIHHETRAREFINCSNDEERKLSRGHRLPQGIVYKGQTSGKETRPDPYGKLSRQGHEGGVPGKGRFWRLLWDALLEEEKRKGICKQRRMLTQEKESRGLTDEKAMRCGEAWEISACNAPKKM